MSSHFSWFLRFIIYIPLCCVLFIGFRVYANLKVTQSIDFCQSILKSTKKATLVVPEFIDCLQQNNNAVVRWYMKPERYYNMIQPQLPCQWVGRWQAKRENISFAIELNARGWFKIDNESMSASNNKVESQYLEEGQGIWSSPSKAVIMWFDGRRIWPIDENKVEWQNANQLVIYELNGEKTYYQRQSPRMANCPYDS